jgi:predicted ribonuclease YlaK
LYNGIKVVEFSDEELADFYSGSLKVDALTNQYVLIKSKDSDTIIDKYKYDGCKFIKVKYKAFESQMLNKIKPRNGGQELLFDLLDSRTPVACVIGQGGVGKSFISTAFALQELQKGNYNKLIIIRNNIGVDNVPDTGFIPGDMLDKLRPFLAFIGDIVSDYGLEMLLNQNKIEMVYLGTIRGRSLSDSIILVSEAQNLTTSLIKTILFRV